MKYLLVLLFLNIINVKVIAENHIWLPVKSKLHCNRIYALKDINDKKQFFFTDSGGGLSPFTYKSTIKEWDVSNIIYKTFTEEGATFTLAKISWPENNKIGFYPDNNFTKNLKVVDCNSSNYNEFCFLKKFMDHGFLGADWYADKVWKLDYINKKVFYSKQSEIGLENASPIGFKVENGARVTHQPSMTIEIDGKVHYMLFDTGATSFYSPEAKKSLNLSDSFCFASFMRTSLFNKLAKRNPEWRIIRKGDRFGGGNDLLRVPKIKLGDFFVGPVWFAARKDSIYNKYSKNNMDRNIDGAVGGNAFKHFIVTIDYTNSKIKFEK